MKKLTKFAAILLAAMMLLASLASCAGNKPQGGNTEQEGSPSQSAEPTAAPTAAPHDHDHDEDPAAIVIGKVGTVEYTMADYLSLYEMSAPYASSGNDVNGMIKDQLIEMGALLTRCDELGIELTEEDEQSVQKQVDDNLDYLLSQMMVDETITDPEELRQAQLRELDAVLTDYYGYTVDSYQQMMLDEMRKNMRVQKLRERTVEGVEFGDADVEEYFRAQLENARELYANDPALFSSAYDDYINGQGILPLYTPEGMFNVKHLLVQFENCTKVPEEEGVFSSEQNAMLNEVRAELQNGISLEDFIARFVSNADYNSDKTMTEPDPENISEIGDYAAPYREHGYIVHEALIGNYFDGFGAAACVLKHGEDWQPESAAEGSEPAKSPVEQYGMVFYETTDGHRIAEVRTNVINGGIHFIFISEELESGEAKMELGSENDPVYTAIAEAGRQERENEFFTAALEDWKKNTPTEFNDELIEHYIAAHYGVG